MELRNNPLVKQFRRAAIAHDESARLLLLHCSLGVSSPLCGEVIYLSGYVAECGLKAVLLNWSPDGQHENLIASFKKPKGLGHDLEKLRGLILRRGCPIPYEITEAMRILAAVWHTPMRYDGRRYSQADAARLYQAGRAILDWIIED